MMAISRAAMNKLVMNYLVPEEFKVGYRFPVRPRVCHDADIQGSDL